MKPNRNSFFRSFALATFLSLSVAWTCAAAVPDPTPTDLGALSSLGHNFSEAHAINANGQVVGESYEGDEPRLKPFIWQNGVMAPLPLPEGFSQGVATSINDAGQVAGYCRDAESLQACLWTYKADGWAMTPLGIPPSFTLPGLEENPEQELTFINSRAVKINNAGQILVMAWGIVGEDEMVDIAVLAIWQGGDWSYLPDFDGLPNVVSRRLFKMNENGQVLFTKENINESDQDLWFWDGETAIELVEAVSLANLNNSGQIVGRYFNFNADTPRFENFTYDTDTKALNSSPVSDGGYSLVGINDNGQVLVEYEPQLTYENGNLKSIRTELGITSFEDWSPATASVTFLGSVDDYIDRYSSLNFNGNGEVSGRCGYTIDKLFYASEKAGVVPLNGFLQDDSHLDVTAMNDSGVIIGRAWVQDSGAHAVLWGEVGSTVPALNIFILPIGPVPVNTKIASGSYLSDSQTNDINSATWDWGDVSTSDGTIDKEDNIVTGEHSYSDPGVYKVELEILNSDQERLSYAVYQYVVVYDPTAGFVTGGGWFNSPEGAYKKDPSLEGQATFGFVSRYKKGATIPTGNTAFEFAAGDLHFQSTSYEWLVVKGSDKASFKGSGTINGEGDYKFMVWAGDSNPDTFRIRIWEEVEATAEEIDIYDNGSDQAINGGSIVIHTK